MRGVLWVGLTAVLASALPRGAWAGDGLGVIGYEVGRAEPAAADAAQRAAAQLASRWLGTRPARVVEGVVAEARGCSDAACFAAIGRAHDQGFVLVIGVERATAAAAYTVSLRLIGVEAANDMGMAQVEAPPGTIDWSAVLAPSLETLLAQVPAPPVPVGALLITSNVAGAEVFLDGNRLGTTPLESVPNLPAGRHQLRLRADRHTDFIREVVVSPDTESRIDTELLPLPPPAAPADDRPLYRRPWVWGVAGAVVVTGVIIAVVVATSGGDTATVSQDAVPIPSLN